MAIITLNRPEVLNAMNSEMLEELVAITGQLKQDSVIRAVVLTGAGSAFCVGADLKSPLLNMETTTEVQQFFRDLVNPIVLNLRYMDKPVIAAVNGVAAGGGMNLALSCDMLIASDKAHFAQAFVNIGAHPDFGGIYALPRLVGTAKACELVFSGKVIDADEALGIGLVNQVVPASQLAATTQELAERLASGPPLAIGLAKASIYRSLGLDVASVLEIEAGANSICILSEDVKEGISAFLRKRKPLFRGR